MSADHKMEHPIHPIPSRLLNEKICPKPHIDSIQKYKELYEESIDNPDEFWARLAKEFLHWHKPFETVRSGDFEHGNIAWFQEADEPDQGRKVTYGELLRDVCRLANVLKSYGVKKGDTVAIYMPMVPEAVISFLACARIGAIHSVVFAGFSSEALKDRILDASSKFVITADEGRRGGKTINIKKIVDAAVKNCPIVEHVLVFRRTGSDVPFNSTRDLWWHDEIKKQRPHCPIQIVNAEDPLFILYTSGSTGKPKGLLHTTGGYLLGSAVSFKYVFDYHEGDIHGCMADIGWVTGHTYIIYGPLANGATSVLFESTPLYPSPSRYWETVKKHKVTQFYTAPTAIRLLRKHGKEHVEGHDLSSLRLIGTVGEPIQPEAWDWYNDVIGRKECPIVDTYWQTETGSTIITPLPGAFPTKPGSAVYPFFGIEPVILDPITGEEIKDVEAEGVLTIRKPWPSIARTIYNDHERYLDTYFRHYHGYYFTGDGVGRDKDGYYWIRGRVDDVINVSGHRLSTAEIESALLIHPSVAEAAVVGVHDDLTGQCVHAFTTLKTDQEGTTDVNELKLQVRNVIGSFATPRRVYIVKDLPKTRSGKIMRRILRKIVAGETDQLGDLTTISDPSLISILIDDVKNSNSK
ncbi:9764_t:CDS:2 [Diversispora eburnea]|uniref:Acetyl-coenzyme A synthetase n=1 Tax=Diversispora eburnea TaxID=1213867 RepID=A0A9N8Z5D9_9GLOM|nr:9764_t:CDS:2 [Diversispora eburnea]